MRGGGSIGGPEDAVPYELAIEDVEVVAGCAGWARGVKLEAFESAGECACSVGVCGDVPLPDRDAFRAADELVAALGDFSA